MTWSKSGACSNISDVVALQPGPDVVTDEQHQQFNVATTALYGFVRSGTVGKGPWSYTLTGHTGEHPLLYVSISG